MWSQRQSPSTSDGATVAAGLETVESPSARRPSAGISPLPPLRSSKNALPFTIVLFVFGAHTLPMCVLLVG